MRDLEPDTGGFFGGFLAGICAGIVEAVEMPDLDANGEPVSQVARVTGRRGGGELDTLDRAAGRVVRRSKRRARRPFPNGEP